MAKFRYVPYQVNALASEAVSNVAFQPQGFQKWSWIRYNEARDLLFCFICVKAVRSKTLKTAKTVGACFTVLPLI